MLHKTQSILIIDFIDIALLLQRLDIPSLITGDFFNPISDILQREIS